MSCCTRFGGFSRSFKDVLGVGGALGVGRWFAQALGLLGGHMHLQAEVSMNRPKRFDRFLNNKVVVQNRFLGRHRWEY